MSDSDAEKARAIARDIERVLEKLTIMEEKMQKRVSKNCEEDTNVQLQESAIRCRHAKNAKKYTSQSSGWLT